MNDKRTIYEVPAVQIMALNIETRILDASLSAGRNDYGTAITDSWD